MCSVAVSQASKNTTWSGALSELLFQEGAGPVLAQCDAWLPEVSNHESFYDGAVGSHPPDRRRRQENAARRGRGRGRGRGANAHDAVVDEQEEAASSSETSVDADEPEDDGSSDVDGNAEEEGPRQGVQTRATCRISPLPQSYKTRVVAPHRCRVWTESANVPKQARPSEQDQSKTPTKAGPGEQDQAGVQLNRNVQVSALLILVVDRHQPATPTLQPSEHNTSWVATPVCHTQHFTLQPSQHNTSWVATP
eukprot:362635-Chlamydomonas_euryale.AAC.1